MYINCVLCVLSFLFGSRRARVAPSVDEAEDEGSYQDKFLPFEPRARRRGRGRGRPRGAGHRRQRELQEDEPIDQDFEKVVYVPEVL